MDSHNAGSKCETASIRLILLTGVMFGSVYLCGTSLHLINRNQNKTWTKYLNYSGFGISLLTFYTLSNGGVKFPK